MEWYWYVVLGVAFSPTIFVLLFMGFWMILYNIALIAGIFMELGQWLFDTIFRRNKKW